MRKDWRRAEVFPSACADSEQRCVVEKQMPVIFFGHGSPMNAIAVNSYTRSISSLAGRIPAPSAVLMISAHWLTKGTAVTHMAKPRTIHDFYGFPPELSAVSYDAPGSPLLADRVASLVKEPVIEKDNSSWGLDHGAWSVLRHLFPKAEIPVVQLSLDRQEGAEFQFQLGKKLRELRSEGVLIVGSGNVVHNLRKISWEEDAPAASWAVAFDAWVKERILERNFTALIADFLATDEGRLSVPTTEHYLPLLTVLGASGLRDNIEFIYEGIQNGSISMRSLMLG